MTKSSRRSEGVRPPSGRRAPTPTPRPIPPPDQVQEHEVWLEESAGAAARLSLGALYNVGGVATWRLGQEDPAVWPLFRAWRGVR